MEISMTELVEALKPENKPAQKHPLHGHRVLAVLPAGFIYFGLLFDLGGGRFKLKNAANVRYWAKRDDGLPEFAEKGPVADDKIDTVSSIVYIESALFFIPLGDWSHG